MDALNSAIVRIDKEVFSLLTLSPNEWLKLLANPEISPDIRSPFMIFKDAYEVTLLLGENDAKRIQEAVSDSRIEGSFRLVTFDVEMGFGTVGFIAKVSEILAEANIPIIVLSSFSRDHLLIKQEKLAAALKALGPYFAELC